MPISKNKFLNAPHVPDKIDDILGNYIMEQNPELAFSLSELTSIVNGCKTGMERPVTESMLKKVLNELVREHKITRKPIITDNGKLIMYYMLK